MATQSLAGAWITPPVAGFPLLETRGEGRTKFNGWGLSGQVDVDLTDVLQLQSITS